MCAKCVCKSTRGRRRVNLRGLVPLKLREQNLAKNTFATNCGFKKVQFLNCVSLKLKDNASARFQKIVPLCSCPD